MESWSGKWKWELENETDRVRLLRLELSDLSDAVGLDDYKL